MKKPLMLRVYESTDAEDNYGWQYDIYGEGEDPIDGGFCTTTRANAVEMGEKQILEIFLNQK